MDGEASIKAMQGYIWSEVVRVAWLHSLVILPGQSADDVLDSFTI